jgi:hypothetical protein
MAQESAQLHEHSLIFAVCCLAGSSTFLEGTGSIEDQNSLKSVIQQHDTPKLFQWLMHAFSFQGIADEIASSYIERHGLPSWFEIEACLEMALCSKLKSYWTFSDCGYRKECCHLP